MNRDMHNADLATRSLCVDSNARYGPFAVMKPEGGAKSGPRRSRLEEAAAVRIEIDIVSFIWHLGTPGPLQQVEPRATSCWGSKNSAHVPPSPYLWRCFCATII